MRKYMLALAALLTPVLLFVPAYASPSPDDIVQPGAGKYIPVIGAIDDLVDVMGEVWKVMTTNPLLLVFLAASLMTVGIKLFRKTKGAAKR